MIVVDVKRNRMESSLATEVYSVYFIIVFAVK